jgi:hypothetical protein
MYKYHDKACFYKYVTSDVAKIILNTLKVKCSSPILFNDPFDSQIEIQHDVVSAEDLIKRTTGECCKILQPLLKNNDVNRAHELVYKKISADTSFVKDRQIAFERFYADVNEKISDFIKDDRIFCVSEKMDNLLMWAHYSDEHKGAVIQFKCIPEKGTALCAAKPVIYSHRVPLLTVEDFFKGEQAIKEYIINGVLLTKSKDWEYEKEWRVILMNQHQYGDYDLRDIFESELSAI